LPFCKGCGKELGEGDKFCKQCGSVQQPVTRPTAPPLPAEPPPAAVAAPASTAPAGSRTPLYILIGVLSILVLAGVIVGIIFLVQGSSEEKAIEEADKYVAEALGYIDEVDALEDDLIAETKSLDFSVGAEQFQVQVESIQKQLQDATVTLDAAAGSLEKIDRPSLPDWWDEYISLLDKAYAEKRKAYQEWDEFITRMGELDEFSQTYQELVNTFGTATSLIDQAYDQHNTGCDNWATAAGSGAYQNAKNLGDTALGELANARALLDKLAKMEPEIDFGAVTDAISQLETYIATMKTSADYGIAVNIDAHFPQCEQVRANKDSLPRSVSWDIAAWIASIRDQYIASIEDHLAREVRFRRRAARVWAENNP